MDPLASPSEPTGTVALTRDDVKTLSSDTRVEILKRLGERRMTVTELAQSLGLSKATVLEHLDKLVGGAFIRRHEDDKRVWVYYDLADKGRRVVFQTSTRFVLLLSSAGVAAVGGGAAFALWAAAQLAQDSGTSELGAAPGPAEDAREGAPSSEPSGSPPPQPPAAPKQSDGAGTEPAAEPSGSPGAWRLVAGLALLLAAALLAWYALSSRRRALDEMATL